MRLVDLVEERAENSRSPVASPFSSHSFTSLASSPTLMTPKGSLSPRRSATSPVAPFRFSTCNAHRRRTSYGSAYDLLRDFPNNRIEQYELRGSSVSAKETIDRRYDFA